MTQITSGACLTPDNINTTSKHIAFIRHFPNHSWVSGFVCTYFTLMGPNKCSKMNWYWFPPPKRYRSTWKTSSNFETPHRFAKFGHPTQSKTLIRPSCNTPNKHSWCSCQWEMESIVLERSDLKCNEEASYTQEHLIPLFGAGQPHQLRRLCFCASNKSPEKTPKIWME